jgi:AbrB family looped-hinge helix DNA binding protein
MRVTSKGQVTIPKAVRDKLGIAPGDEVGFREEGQAIVLENANKAADPGSYDRLKDAIARFRSRHVVRDGWGGKSVDDIMEELRGYSEDADDPGFQRRP